MTENRTSPEYEFTLFITGATPRSMRAVANMRKFCDLELADRSRLEVVDLYSNPERAKADQIVAAPTLVRHVPLPRRYAIGDLSDFDALRQVMVRT